MKRLLFFSLLIFAVASLSAQDSKWSIGVGGGLSVPVSDLHDYSKTGFDGFAYGAYNISPNVSVGLGYNYVFFSDKKLSSGIKMNHVQVNSYLVKGFYYFGESEVRPFIGASTGWYNIREKATYTANSVKDVVKSTDDNWGYGVELGARAANWTLSGSFNQAASNVNYFLINVGYIINL